MRFASGILVATLLLSGCSAAAEPVPVSLPTISASPSPSPARRVPVVPIVPAEARAATPRGAAAFARFYIKEVDNAFDSPGKLDLASFSEPMCSACQRILKSLKTIEATGRTAAEPRLKIISSRGSTVMGGKSLVKVTYEVPSRAPTEKADAALQTASARVVETTSVMLRWRGPSWVVESLAIP